MIDYSIFHFAAPPRTGVGWFIAAAQLAGLGPGFRHHAHVPFGRRVDEFRASLVRHPCDWLASCYAAKGRWSNGLAPFGRLDLRTWDGFVRSYLRRRRGAVGRLYNGYEADAVMRIEDAPWAMIELLEEFGVEKALRENCLLLDRKPSSRWRSRWDDGLRREVLEAEREVCEKYDYC